MNDQTTNKNEIKVNTAWTGRKEPGKVLVSLLCERGPGSWKKRWPAVVSHTF